MERYQAQTRHREEGLGTVSSDGTDLVDSPWESSPSLWSILGWGEKKMEEMGGWEGEESEIVMYNKIVLKNKNK